MNSRTSATPVKGVSPQPLRSNALSSFALARSGRDLSLSSTYLARRQEGSEKRKVHRAVTEFFVRFAQPQPIYGGFRFFTLPGLEWTFEHGLIDAMGRHNPDDTVHFTSCERNLSVLHKGIPHMPKKNGDTVQWRTHWLMNGRIDYAVADIVDSYTHVNQGTKAWRIRNRCLNIDANTLLTLTPRNFAAGSMGSPDEKCLHLRQKFGGCHGIWLDYMSMLCPSVMNALPKLHLWTDVWATEIPIVISVQRAREDRTTSDLIEGFGGRSETIRWLIDRSPNHRFLIFDEIKYFDTTPMLVVLGLLKKVTPGHSLLHQSINQGGPTRGSHGPPCDYTTDDTILPAGRDVNAGVAHD